jgi:DNA repair exonuclease SbcCD ATPase subunit
MILKRVEAENILKYRKLRLTGLPSHGQIAVVGPNEAGKTAVGETVCLGLFGRTFSLDPDQLDRVIRWGEYHGRVVVEFIGRDGGDYIVARDIDNTGQHEARLFIAGEEQPLAEGVQAVGEAIRELGGFTYKSFVDSFYLAQREMEVPHGKSATVKALIGVDQLEAAATALRDEMTETAKAIRALEAQTQHERLQIAEINLDRAHLGRVESQREAKLEAANAAEGECVQLTARAEAIGKAATCFVEASRKFVESTLHTNYEQWRDRKQSVATGLVAVADAARASGLAPDPGALESAGAAIRAFDNGLAEYDKVRDLARLYRGRLAYLLEDRPESDDGEPGGGQAAERTEPRYADQRAATQQRIEKVKGYRRPVLVLGVFLLELACLAWAGWIILRAAPDSAPAGWLQSVIGLGESARDLLLLFSAIGGSVLATVMFMIYARATGKLREGREMLERIEVEVQASRDEMSVIDAIQEAPVPDALNALRGVRNDLLNSAVVSFTEGDGAVLVRPDALAAKLKQIRGGSHEAARSLRQAQQRFTTRAGELEQEAAELREAIGELDQEIATERERWEQVEALERAAAGLEAKANELRHEIVTRKLGCELIDGACRRVYARFHPELRRFVGKILPRLTDDRYEYLEIDDDLHVRVFCKEKNDFVGLAEISNGTHRQLMLCVRLALSQALIASSSKARQFIFFDEPFVFFDERRMKQAIDVLRRISPQITQVWLAAQKFDDLSAFDMLVHCGVEGDCLEVSGNGKADPTDSPPEPVEQRAPSMA